LRLETGWSVPEFEIVLVHAIEELVDIFLLFFLRSIISREHLFIEVSFGEIQLGVLIGLNID
jgi:hypothetical protein